MSEQKFEKKLKYVDYNFDTFFNDNSEYAPYIIYALLLFLPPLLMYAYSPIKFDFIKFDLFITLIYVFHHLVIREGILTGRIKAYYRRYKDSDGLVIKLYNAIMPISIFRTIVYLIYYLLWESKSFSVFTAHILSKLDPFSIELLVALSFSLLTLYKAYYEKRYTTPEEFTNAIVYRKYHFGMSDATAKNDFCLQKDAEYGIIDYHYAHGYKYDSKKAEAEYEKLKWQTAKTQKNIDEGAKDEGENLRANAVRRINREKDD